MTLTLKYFGLLADIAQKNEEEFFLDETKASVAVLKSKMENIYLELKNTNYSIAVNQSMSSLENTIKDQDVIAFLPPFAGG